MFSNLLDHYRTIEDHQQTNPTKGYKYNFKKGNIGEESL